MERRSDVINAVCTRGLCSLLKGPSRAGFTRTELLVVCGVAFVLLAVLLATQIRSRDSTGRGQCRNSLREIGQAMAQYVSEHGNRYPRDWNNDPGSPREMADETSPTGFWCNQGFDAVLRPYLRTQRGFVCPGDVWLNQNLSTWGSRNSFDDTSYGINISVQNRSLTSVSDPAETILLGHTRFEHTIFEDNRSVLWETHERGNNYLSCDGSAQFLSGPATFTPKDLWKHRRVR